MLEAEPRRRTPRLDIAWRPNSYDHPRFGLVVPRYGHTAVRRNRLRRQVRELIRRNVLRRVPPLDLVIRPRPAAYRASRSALAADLDQWLEALRP